MVLPNTWTQALHLFYNTWSVMTNLFLWSNVAVAALNLQQRVYLTTHSSFLFTSSRPLFRLLCLRERKFPGLNGSAAKIEIWLTVNDLWNGKKFVIYWKTVEKFFFSLEEEDEGFAAIDINNKWSMKLWSVASNAGGVDKEILRYKRETTIGIGALSTN